MKKRNRDINIFSMSALDLFASALGAFLLLAVVFMPFFPNSGIDEEGLATMQQQFAEQETRMQAIQAENADLQAQLAQAQGEIAQLTATVQNLQQQLAAAEQRAQALEGQLGQAQAAQAAAEQRVRELEQQLESLMAMMAELEERPASCEVCRPNEGVEQNSYIVVTMRWSSDDDIDLHVIAPNGNEYKYNARSFDGSDARFAEDSRDGPGNEVWFDPHAARGTYQVHFNYYSDKSGSNTLVSGGVITQAAGVTDIPAVELRTVGVKVHVANVNVDDEGNIEVELVR